jgi:5'-nucleotidase
MDGGDGYEVFKMAKNRVDTGFLMSDVVVDYIRDRSPIR